MPTTLLRPGRPRGFTLVELLVVIAIIGVLVALLLPAVQAAREAARRVHCQNNFKQVMLALLNYHENHKEFPAGQENAYTPGFGQNTPQNQNHSHVPHILPQLELQAVHDRYDFSLPWNEGVNRTITQSTREGLAQDISALLCPSTQHEETGLSDIAAIVGADGVTYNTYPEKGEVLITNCYCKGGDFASGVLIPVPGQKQKSGPDKDKWLRTTRVRSSKITDGLSQTMVLGECGGRTDGNKYWADGDHSFTHHTIINGPNRGNELCSDHVGGINIALADGSVRFLEDFTSKKVIDYLSTRGGNEIMPADF